MTTCSSSPVTVGARDHFMATVTVSRDGVVDVPCYDRREANDNPAYHARFAASFDGGLTVSPRVQVSAAPNDPKTQRDGEPFSVIGGDHRHALGSAVSIDPGIEHPALRGESRTIAGLRAHQCHSRAARWSLASRRGEP